MARHSASGHFASVAVLALGMGFVAAGCAPLIGREGGDPATAPVQSAQAAPAPMLAVTPVPRPPVRGATPARPALPPAAVPEAPAPSQDSAAVAAPAPDQDAALPDAISRALTQGAEPGSVLDSVWRGSPARFNLGLETPAIRTMALPRAEGVRPPGPLEVLAEPLLVIRQGQLSHAADPAAPPARQLERGVIVFAMGLTGERDWAAIAEGGVMIGYVPAEILAPLSATGPIATVPPRTALAAAVEMTPAATRCRAITVAQGQTIQTAEACLHPDGTWRVSAAPR